MAWYDGLWDWFLDDGISDIANTGAAYLNYDWMSENSWTPENAYDYWLKTQMNESTPFGGTRFNPETQTMESYLSPQMMELVNAGLSTMFQPSRYSAGNGILGRGGLQEASINENRSYQGLPPVMQNPRGQPAPNPPGDFLVGLPEEGDSPPAANLDPGISAGNIGETGQRPVGPSFNPVLGDRPGGPNQMFPGMPGANGPGTFTGGFDALDWISQNGNALSAISALSGIPGLGFLDNLANWYYSNMGTPEPGNPMYGGDGLDVQQFPYALEGAPGVYNSRPQEQPHISPMSGNNYAFRRPGDMSFYNSTIWDRNNPGMLPMGETTQPGDRYAMGQNMLPPWMENR